MPRKETSLFKSLMQKKKQAYDEAARSQPEYSSEGSTQYSDETAQDLLNLILSGPTQPSAESSSEEPPPLPPYPEQPNFSDSSFSALNSQLNKKLVSMPTLFAKVKEQLKGSMRRQEMPEPDQKLGKDIYQVLHEKYNELIKEKPKKSASMKELQIFSNNLDVVMMCLTNLENRTRCCIWHQTYAESEDRKQALKAITFHIDAHTSQILDLYNSPDDTTGLEFNKWSLAKLQLEFLEIAVNGLASEHVNKPLLDKIVEECVKLRNLNAEWDTLRPEARQVVYRKGKSQVKEIKEQLEASTYKQQSKLKR